MFYNFRFQIPKDSNATFVLKSTGACIAGNFNSEETIHFIDDQTSVTHLVCPTEAPDCEKQKKDGCSDDNAVPPTSGATTSTGPPEEKVDPVGLPVQNSLVTNQPLSASQVSLRSNADYDSSATLSADEGPGGPTHETVAGGATGSVAPSLTSPNQRTPAPPAPLVNDQPGDGVTNASDPSSFASSSSSLLMTSQSPSQQVAPTREHAMRHMPTQPVIPSRRVSELYPQQGRQQFEQVVTDTHESRAKPQVERRSSPACVRDLINSAIERNLSQTQQNGKDMPGHRSK